MTIQEQIQSLKSELAETRQVWINLNQQTVEAMIYAGDVARLEKQISDLEHEFQSQSDCSNADELAQSSPSSVAFQGAATYSQILLDGVYDVVAPVVAKVKRRLKPVDSSPPVQTTLFELLKPFAKAQYEKMQALFRLYTKDLEELKNPLSQLSKILGRKRQSNLDGA